MPLLADPDHGAVSLTRLISGNKNCPKLCLTYGLEFNITDICPNSQADTYIDLKTSDNGLCQWSSTMMRKIDEQNSGVHIYINQGREYGYQYSMPGLERTKEGKKRAHISPDTLNTHTIRRESNNKLWIKMKSIKSDIWEPNTAIKRDTENIALFYMAEHQHKPKPRT